MTPDVHPELEPLAFLIGTWRGHGRGEYPTIEDFTYEEEVTFGHVGKPFLTYHQKTWSPKGDPLHTEQGYVRPGGSEGPELVIAQPTGVVEIHVGPLHGTKLAFRARSVALSPTAKSVTAVSRTIEVLDGVLRYRVDMAAVDQPLQFHLEAALERQTGPAG